jgi:hypothetical protein
MAVAVHVGSSAAAQNVRPTTAACWSASFSSVGSASMRAASSARTVLGIAGSEPPLCSRWRTISSA